MRLLLILVVCSQLTGCLIVKDIVKKVKDPQPGECIIYPKIHYDMKLNHDLDGKIILRCVA